MKFCGLLISSGIRVGQEFPDKRYPQPLWGKGERLQADADAVSVRSLDGHLAFLPTGFPSVFLFLSQFQASPSHFSPENLKSPEAHVYPCNVDESNP